MDVYYFGSVSFNEEECYTQLRHTFLKLSRKCRAFTRVLFILQVWFILRKFSVVLQPVREKRENYRKSFSYLSLLRIL